jgi:hypothetical protein
MKTYRAETTIAASPEAIWAVLTDAAGYPAWDPWAERIEGQIAPGARLKAYTKLSPGRAFPVTVTTFEPGRRMVWTGGLPLGLFRGVRTFTLTPQGDGQTGFAVEETFSGPLLPLFAGSLPDMTQPFADFAAGLKAHVEAGTGA